MAKKFDFLSPGIEIREIDQSFLPTERDAEGPIIIGRTRKGPANKPVKIRNLDDFVSVFGLPIPGGNGPQGDMWRDGNYAAPTYASYAAQAWLASEESPVTIVRLAGEQSPNSPTDFGLAGWDLSKSPASAAGDNSTAYGLFLVSSGSKHFGTGSLAAVFYAESGYLALDGIKASDPGGSAVQKACTFIKSNNTSCGFSLEIRNASGDKVGNSLSFNFDRNSANYIRSVFNTNPQLTNTATTPVAQLKTYWLGESFTRELVDKDLLAGAAGSVYGILLPLEEGVSSVNWGDHREGAAEAQTGYLISQKSRGQEELFRFKTLHVGSDVEKEYMIGIEQISEPNNPNVDSYGSFTVCIKTTAGQTVERFSGCNLNPSSPNYIGKKIGDQYIEWDESKRRYRTYGDYQNQSNYVYVDIKQFVKDGSAQGHLPVGFKGPVRPAGFTLAFNSVGPQNFGDSTNAGTPSRRTVAITALPTTGSFLGLTSSAGTKYRIQFDHADTLVAASATAFTASSGQEGSEFGATLGTKDIGNDTVGKGNMVDRLQTLLTSIGAIQDASGLANPFRSHITVSGSTLAISSSANGTDVAAPGGFDGSPGITLGSITAGTDTDDVAGKFVKGGTSVPASLGTSTRFVEGPNHFTASFNFPSIALRGDGTEGGAADPYRTYYGIRPTLSTATTIHDPDYCDYLRRLPAGVNSFAPATHYEHSFIFTLDDLVVNESTNSVTYTSGSWSESDTGPTVSWTSPQNAESNQNGTMGELFDLGVRQFLLPLHGGFEGWDITEKEPLRDALIGTTRNDKTNYLQYTMNKALDSVKDPEVVPANLLLMPGIKKPVITNRMISVAEDRKDVLAIIDLENDYKPMAEREKEDLAALDQKPFLGSVTSAVTSLKARSLNSSYACAFYPSIQVTDNLNASELVWLPASVAGLGAMAKAQATSELWFAPAGFNRGGLGSLGGQRGPRVVQARQRLDSKERDSLYEVNINPIATFPAEGVVIFGQKTLQADASALDRINVRRLVLYLKSEVSAVARNLLFDQNLESTWNRFKAEVGPLLSDTQARFGLADYRLVLDKTTTTADLIDRNIMYAKIFIKPARAIEYIVVDFVITRTGADFV